ncbi:MAG: poly-gamma-glutamate system protein [Tissierellia bacterium]|nr:poly-gamma-glutamate system protein [Tissierellia bacterium]
MKNLNRYLILLLIFLIISLSLVEMTKKEIYTESDYIHSLKRVEEAFEEIKNYKLSNGIIIDKSIDINETGILGPEFNGLTTTLGSLESKRTATNPELVIAIIKEIEKLNLKEGDHVAINMSGSFPTINIMTIIAIEDMNLKPVIISSIGSSNYGANDPELVYFDMENLLYEKALINHKSIAISSGGDRDLGLNMDSKMLKKIVDRIDVDYIYIEDLDENIDYRYSIYRSYDPKAFINIGGNLVSFGLNSKIPINKSGVLDRLPINDDSNGLSQKFLKDNIKVLNILNIKDLAHRYDIPIDPIPIPRIDSDYRNIVYVYDKFLISFSLIIAIFMIIVISYKRKNKSII